MTPRRLASAGLLLLYFVVMFPLIHRLDQLGEYASYVFEAVFVLVTAFIFRNRIGFALPLRRRIAPDAILVGVAGFVVFKLAHPLSLTIPFDLHSSETILFLLIIGPVLEECVFRLAQWELWKELLSNETAALWLTTVAFSFAHLFAWWSVPEEFRSFVIYQAVYTLGLGFYCGLRRKESGSVSVPVLLHASFNAGFFIASRV
jgi:hypothetical protein